MRRTRTRRTKTCLTKTSPVSLPAPPFSGAPECHPSRHTLRYDQTIPLMPPRRMRRSQSLRHPVAGFPSVSAHPRRPEVRSSSHSLSVFFSLSLFAAFCPLLRGRDLGVDWCLGLGLARCHGFIGSGNTGQEFGLLLLWGKWFVAPPNLATIDNNNTKSGSNVSLVCDGN